MARTHYENLKVTQTASDKEIQKAYRLLAQKWHPDKNTHRTEEAEKNIKIINEAYRVLSNPALRESHDRWIRATENELAPEQAQSSPQDNIHRRQYGYGDNPYRRKRSKQTYQSFRVSKKYFTRVLIALIGIPAVLGVVAFNADKISDLLIKGPVFMASKPDNVAADANVGKEIEKGLYEFFAATNRSLLLVIDTDSAIAALPELEELTSYIIDFSTHLDAADRTTKSNASNAVAVGMRVLGPQIVKLQSESRIWAILYPTLDPMLQALRRIAG